MKLKTSMLTALGVFALASANAGEKAVCCAPTPADLGVTLGVGYDSHYIFRGVNNGENAIWTSLDYAIPSTPLSVGVRYINPTDGGVANPWHGDELDLSLRASQDVGFATVWVGYTAYLFPENAGRNGGDATHEVGLGLAKSLGIVDLGVAAYYDFEIDGWFFDLNGSKTIAITDGIDVKLSAGITYGVDYWTNGSGFNNVYLRAGVPVKLCERATLEPYLGATFALDQIDAFQDDQLFGGVSLNVTF